MSVLSEIYHSQSGIRGARSGRGIPVPVSSVMARCAALYDREHSDVGGNMQKRVGTVAVSAHGLSTCGSLGMP